MLELLPQLHSAPPGPVAGGSIACCIVMTYVVIR